ncbi:solute carrier family 35 member G2-like [Ptychodera flava]|uniref:solute carrier family 35 member G2-like n=1 Tax=Ptychodera flava TaxID=63121 RepID=UPI00396A7AB3
MGGITSEGSYLLSSDDGEKSSCRSLFLGAAFAGVSGSLYGIIGFISAILIASGIFPYQQMFLMFGVSTVISVTAVLWQRQRVIWGVRTTIVMVGFGSALGFSYAAYCTALLHIPVGTLTGLKTALFPVCSVIGGVVYLKEPLKISDVVGTGLTIVATLLFLHPTSIFGDNRRKTTPIEDEAERSKRDLVIGYSFSLLYAAILSVIVITSSAVDKDVSNHTKAFYGNTISCLISVIFMLSMETPVWRMKQSLAGMLVALCISNTIAVSALTASSQHGRAALVSVILNMDFPVAYILQYIFLEENPPIILEVVGGLLILVSACVMTLMSAWDSKRNMQKGDEPTDGESRAEVQDFN